MGKMNNGGRGKSNYACTEAELDAANRKAHVPHGPRIPAQTESGAKAIAAAHGKIHDRGPLMRTKATPEEQSSALDGSVDLPYQTPNYD